MKKAWAKKEYIAIAIVVVLFAFVSYTSLSSIRLLHGNARVVNYVGIVRGATQKLIKEEIMGWQLTSSDPAALDDADWYPDDALIERLDSIIEELLTGEGPNDLVVLQDDEYLNNMRQVQAHWGELKDLIADVREGDSPDELFQSSQIYFELVNETVFSAERYSEAQVNRIMTILIVINAVFILIIVLGVVAVARSLSVRRRADALGKIAYIDSLTEVGNRASCEREMERIDKCTEDKKLAVFMFDMNDLKQTNDLLGHQWGDRIIASFAAILKSAAAERGFVGRFGGDEFIAFFESPDEDEVESFLNEVRSEVDAYNDRQTDALKQIKYAVGCIITETKGRDIEDIVHDADNAMYQNKRELKGL